MREYVWLGHVSYYLNIFDVCPFPFGVLPLRYIFDLKAFDVNTLPCLSSDFKLNLESSDLILKVGLYSKTSQDDL
jgi:hypothetical protein